ncbi:sensor histidine kinase [Microvirga sp. 17 mud 1-3]|uniref:sensor histidine kinase n=1 Tax=Microvirga sp. 17 mud 1-3 TaxID=2082949 RepID=UPI000D6D11D6|nr:HWE histidine kinase domain-containing protein [Microvirga sp. 17 mud 1-3]AWM85317.1 histidine kinase [Microvirga sp. 17 mud 1-3]
MTQADDMSVLILAPHGRDGTVAAAILSEVGIKATICPSPEALVAALDRSACAVITEEALLNADRRELADWINLQPPWSDMPFILLTHRGGSPVEHLTQMLGNVTMLERPFHPAVLVNAVRSALRARQRQKEVEVHLQERQRTHERQALLIRELHHRVKNTLATVQGLLGATARSTHSVEEFYNSFADRIVSLSNTHNLLTEDYWQTAPLIEMFKNELSHYDDGAQRRITLDGPPVELSADLAVPVGMAVHELTTNAAKHGALSVPGGQIAVVWRVQELGPGRRLDIDWIERGGPLVGQPNRKGFGSTLLHRVLTHQCRAAINIVYEPKGLACHMEIPLVEERLVPEY